MSLKTSAVLIAFTLMAGVNNTPTEAGLLTSIATKIKIVLDAKDLDKVGPTFTRFLDPSEELDEAIFICR